MRKKELEELKSLYKVMLIDKIETWHTSDYGKIDYEKASSLCIGIFLAIETLLKMNGVDQNEIDLLERQLKKEAQDEYLMNR